MIKNTLKLAILALCLYSCSLENTDQITGQGNDAVSRLHKTGINPENPANPYDGIGKIHNNLLLTLKNDPSQSTTNSIVSFVETQAFLSEDFSTLAGENYLPISSAQEKIIENSNIEAVLDAGQFSDTAKDCFSVLFSTFSAPGSQQAEFSVVYNSLINYEQDVLLDANLNGYEKETILVTAAIARYAAALDKGKGKDKDWKLTINNIVAAASGAAESEAKAITMAIAGGIYHARRI